MDLPIFDVNITPQNLGMFAISFVDEPAIEEDFVFFKKDKETQPLYFFNDKHEVVSPVLIPNQLIYRNQNGKEFYLRWTAQAIEQASTLFLLNQFQNNVTIMHPMFYDENLKLEETLESDVYLKRMWITESKDDVINTKYGYKLPIGSLCVHYKIHNRKLWQRIKSGELKGLSIEALTDIVLAQNKNNIINQNKMSKKKLNVNDKSMSMLNKFVLFLNEVVEDAENVAVEAEKDTTESGEVEIKYEINETDFIVVGSDGVAKDQNGEVMKEGKYLLKDGNTLVVDAEGKFAGTEATAEVEVEAPVEAPIAQAEIEAPVEKPKEVEKEKITINEVEYEVEKAVADYIKSLETEKTEIETAATVMRKEVQNLQKRIPSTQPVSIVQSKIEVKEESKEVSLSDIISKLHRK